MTQKLDIDLPYFDYIFQKRLEGSPIALEAFARHVHYGFWKEPGTADVSYKGFAEAAETMTDLVVETAGISNGMRVLDVGCGFGGTLANMNEKFSQMELCGLNIDQRQIDYAKELVKPRNGNHVVFTEGDAVDLPFEDASFDVVLAVECICHFSDRLKFIAEAKRVLRKGGCLCLTDEVHDRKNSGYLNNRFFNKINSVFDGNTNNCSIADYKKAYYEEGFSSALEMDITKNVLPTLKFIKNILKGKPIEWFTMKVTEDRLMKGRSCYMLYRFSLPVPNG